VLGRSPASGCLALTGALITPTIAAASPVIPIMSGNHSGEPTNRTDAPGSSEVLFALRFGHETWTWPDILLEARTWGHER